MVKRSQKRVVGFRGSDTARCCKVESIISVDERGQMVLPVIELPVSEASQPPC